MKYDQKDYRCSVLFGIKMDAVDLLMVWWCLVLFSLKWKSAFKEKLKGGLEPLSGKA